MKMTFSQQRFYTWPRLEDESFETRKWSIISRLQWFDIVTRCDWLKTLGLFFNQSGERPKPTVTRLVLTRFLALSAW